MAIISRVSVKDLSTEQMLEGWYCDLNSSFDGRYLTKSRFEGLCIVKYEINGYDDSDFMVNYWDPEERRVKSELYASTRFHTDCEAFVDIKEEYKQDVKDYYDNLIEEGLKKRRDESLQNLLRDRSKQSLIAKKHEVKNFQVRRALKSMNLNEDETDRIYTLLLSNLRSNFRKSLRNAIIEWMKNDNPKYPSPLSRKQISYL